jgi:coenzyme F420-0:L-glutamate ligase/coenzyme F420-1:gamma-L-glutamate ligase
MLIRDTRSFQGNIPPTGTVALIPLPGFPLIQPGDDLAAPIVHSLTTGNLQLADGDILVVTQKIVSKAEGRFIDLSAVHPSAQALELAERTQKDPRLVEVILWDTTEVVRARPGVLIVQHRLGFISANAGVDRSNVAEPEREWVLRLPADPDESARWLRARLGKLTGATPAVIIADSHGRPWREGTVGVAIGLAGLVPVQDLRGHPDLFGYQLQYTTVGLADQVAAAASLVMGQADEGRPVVLVRGLTYEPGEDVSACQILRPREMDLFR